MKHKTKTVTLPSGIPWTFRETSGADDDLLSNLSLDTNVLISAYLASISVSEIGKPPITSSDIDKLKLRDKYALLIFSRMFSLGETLIFTYQFDTGKQEYEVDLNRYIWDYTNPDFPTELHPDYFDQRIPPYDPEEVMEKQINPELRVKLDFLDGVGEGYLLKLPAPKRTINQQLLARNFRVLKDGEWRVQKVFSEYTSRDMAQIRALYEEYDPNILGLIDLMDPDTGQQVRVSLLEVRDFFFPTKI
jgi:hypothetical protein